MSLHSVNLEEGNNLHQRDFKKHAGFCTPDQDSDCEWSGALFLI